MNLLKQKKERNYIGITIGDPAGLGPEVSLRAVDAITDGNFCPILIGRYEVIERYAKQLSLTKKLKRINPLNTTSIITTDSLHVEEDRINVFDVETNSQMPLPKHGNAETGRESLLYIDTAVSLWKNGIIDAIATAPVSKAFIEASGTQFSGHTEYFAESIGETAPYMMMYSPDYSVLLVTTHIAICNLPPLLTEKSIYDTIMVGKTNMARIRGRAPKLAVCGFDPHCGDDGAINNFDATVTKAAIAQAKASGADVVGPFAADTLFLTERWKQFDLVIAHYHDQGLIPFKMVAFDTGVNVTLGLSLVRTSADHGTAFDIAGDGVASFSSMKAAIELADALLTM